MEALEAWLLAVEAGSDGPQQLEVVAQKFGALPQGLQGMWTMLS